MAWKHPLDELIKKTNFLNKQIEAMKAAAQPFDDAIGKTMRAAGYVWVDEKESEKKTPPTESESEKDLIQAAADAAQIPVTEVKRALILKQSNPDVFEFVKSGKITLDEAEARVKISGQKETRKQLVVRLLGGRTKKAIYSEAKVHPSDFSKWEKGMKHRDGSKIDLRIRHVLGLPISGDGIGSKSS